MSAVNILFGTQVAISALLLGSGEATVLQAAGVMVGSGLLCSPWWISAWRAKRQKRQKASQDADLYVVDVQKTEDLQLAVVTREVARRLSNEGLAERLRVLCDLVDAWSLHAPHLGAQDTARSRHGIRVVQKTCQRMDQDEQLLSSEIMHEDLDRSIRILSRQLAGQLVRVEQGLETEDA